MAAILKNVYAFIILLSLIMVVTGQHSKYISTHINVFFLINTLMFLINHI